jgi:hypothetical protein
MHAIKPKRFGAGVPQRLASSVSWHSRADGWAARTGLRRMRWSISVARPA